MSHDTDDTTTSPRTMRNQREAGPAGRTQRARNPSNAAARGFARLSKESKPRRVRGHVAHTHSKATGQRVTPSADTCACLRERRVGLSSLLTFAERPRHRSAQRRVRILSPSRSGSWLGARASRAATRGAPLERAARPRRPRERTCRRPEDTKRASKRSGSETERAPRPAVGRARSRWCRCSTSRLARSPGPRRARFPARAGSTVLRRLFGWDLQTRRPGTALRGHPHPRSPVQRSTALARPYFRGASALERGGHLLAHVTMRSHILIICPSPKRRERCASSD
jgi:hypothetical protein